MNLRLQTAMLAAWHEWHRGFEPDDVPAVTPAFERGFRAAHDLLFPLLAEAAPHVFASAEAEHLLDGFRRQRRPLDELADRVRALVPDVQTEGAARPGED